MDRRALDRFRRNRGALLGLVLVVVVILFSFIAPLLSTHAPNIPDFDHGRGPFGTPGPPSNTHWLGTDTIFRDLLVRLAHGGRLSLEVAFVATTIAVALGTAVGVASGYFKGTRVRLDAILDTVAVPVALTGALIHASIPRHRLIGLAAWLFAAGALLRLPALRRAVGWFDLVDAMFGATIVFLLARRGIAALGDHATAMAVVALGFASLTCRAIAERSTTRRLPFFRVDFDDVAMRGVDVLLAFPFLLLVMALSAAIERTSEATIFLVLGLTAWTGTARVIRSKTLQLRDLEFVVASRALGQSTPHILARHILPNVVGIAIVLGTNSVASMIVAEAALSFLGLSLPPPAASWGRMLDDGRPYYSVAPWLLAAPAVAILIAVLGFNLLGEGLRDAFDPKDA
jgi:ABC-type dipeptide/oligopeptide/nickel transport system permease subunit